MTKRELLQQELKSVIMRLTDEQARQALAYFKAQDGAGGDKACQTEILNSLQQG